MSHWSSWSTPSLKQHSFTFIKQEIKEEDDASEVEQVVAFDTASRHSLCETGADLVKAPEEDANSDQPDLDIDAAQEPSDEEGVGSSTTTTSEPIPTVKRSCKRKARESLPDVDRHQIKDFNQYDYNELFSRGTPLAADLQSVPVHQDHRCARCYCKIFNNDCAPLDVDQCHRIHINTNCRECNNHPCIKIARRMHRAANIIEFAILYATREPQRTEASYPVFVENFKVYMKRFVPMMTVEASIEKALLEKNPGSTLEDRNLQSSKDIAEMRKDAAQGRGPYGDREEVNLIVDGIFDKQVAALMDQDELKTYCEGVREDDLDPTPPAKGSQWAEYQARKKADIAKI